ncbi:putative lipid-transfer protein DIR1 [Aristolochia californica]|uniref:putative lipid-transfer protein DIR1 n=1 Tax=Aristolochia californica TaxID=171875 RepID=UPI0035E13947
MAKLVRSLFKESEEMEKMMKVAAVVMLLVVVIGGEVVRSNADGFCDITQEGLYACKPSVSGPKPVTPSEACCKALKGANMPCLCSYKNKNILQIFGIDPKLAMDLPAKCHLPPPPC